MSGEPMKFRKKPVVIEAIQLRWDTWNEVCDFASVGEGRCRGVYVNQYDRTEWSDAPRFAGYELIGLIITTVDGEVLAIQDDWIIKGVAGELYPCKPDIFKQTYEAVESRGTTNE